MGRASRVCVCEHVCVCVVDIFLQRNKELLALIVFAWHSTFPMQVLQISTDNDSRANIKMSGTL